jgi:hypothetical protein
VSNFFYTTFRCIMNIGLLCLLELQEKPQTYLFAFDGALPQFCWRASMVKRFSRDLVGGQWQPCYHCIAEGIMNASELGSYI